MDTKNNIETNGGDTNSVIQADFAIDQYVDTKNKKATECINNIKMKKLQEIEKDINIISNEVCEDLKQFIEKAEPFKDFFQSYYLDNISSNIIHKIYNRIYNDIKQYNSKKYIFKLQIFYPALYPCYIYSADIQIIIEAVKNTYLNKIYYSKFINQYIPNCVTIVCLPVSLPIACLCCCDSRCRFLNLKCSK